MMLFSTNMRRSLIFCVFCASCATLPQSGTYGPGPQPAPVSYQGPRFVVTAAAAPAFLLGTNDASYGYTRIALQAYDASLGFGVRLTPAAWWLMARGTLGLAETGVLRSTAPSTSSTITSVASADATLLAGAMLGPRVYLGDDFSRFFFEGGGRFNALVGANPAIPSALRLWPGAYLSAGWEWRFGDLTGLDVSLRPNYFFGVGKSGLFMIEAEVGVAFYL